MEGLEAVGTGAGDSAGIVAMIMVEAAAMAAGVDKDSGGGGVEVGWEERGRRGRCGREEVIELAGDGAAEAENV